MLFKNTSLIFKLAICLFPSVVAAKQSLGIGEFRYGPDMSENVACQLAEDRAKEHAIKKFVGERIEATVSERCEESGCDFERNTYEEVNGYIKSVISRDQKVIKQPGYSSCIVSLVADVERQENPVYLYLDKSIFNYRENEEVKFRGVVNRKGVFAIYNLYDGNYHRVYVTNIAAPNKEFMIPSKQDTGKILATLPKGQSQSKEMLMFLFSERWVDFKETYTPMEMNSLIYSLPSQQRRVVNRYVNIVR